MRVKGILKVFIPYNGCIIDELAYYFLDKYLDKRLKLGPNAVVGAPASPLKVAPL